MNRIGDILADYMEYDVIRDLSDGLSHGILVSNLAYRVAREMELPEAICYQMAVAGMLHDIGKIQLSQYLYGRREGGLEIEELRYTRTHPVFGYLILREHGYDREIADAVMHHHENYDGSGYPDNLEGEEIPLGARILRACDVFAALVSERPYREAFSTETAVELMIEEVKNFDMQVFLAFQRVVGEPDFETIQRQIEAANANSRRRSIQYR